MHWYKITSIHEMLIVTASMQPLLSAFAVYLIINGVKVRYIGLIYFSNLGNGSKSIFLFK